MDRICATFPRQIWSLSTVVRDWNFFISKVEIVEIFFVSYRQLEPAMAYTYTHFICSGTSILTGKWIFKNLPPYQLKICKSQGVGDYFVIGVLDSHYSSIPFPEKPGLWWS